uniref:Ig-like domain-containing protein n=1 Tax=Nothobranchius furzeri TaxID=105023 RepID=A0A8C6LWX6_NOTFU
MIHVSSALKQKPTLVVPPLTEGQQTTLTCTAPGLCPGSPPNITWSSTLTFNPSAEHHGTNITCKISFTGDTTTEETVTLSVTYLNLTCSVESFPPSLIKWTKHSENKVYVQTDSGSASLLIPNVTTEDSGRYICTAEHLDEKVSVEADVTVTCK